MIGCIARAKSRDLNVDQEEMETVQWVPKDGECGRAREGKDDRPWPQGVACLKSGPRSARVARWAGHGDALSPQPPADLRCLTDVRAAVQKHGRSEKEGPEGQSQHLSFDVPPPFAIAYHLLKLWAEHGGAWFAETTVSRI